ncbi:MAG: M16 family metallopeptidase [Candidatus Zixiibacteriota bacterium]
MSDRRAEAAMQSYRKTTLRSGLRVLTEEMPAVRSVSLGVWVDVGARNESVPENGLSHLVEHMVFKGTKRRSAKQLAFALESLGGSLNAFTSREQTCFMARVLDEHLPAAIDILADLTCNATMTAANLTREKQVIGEEIKESIDTPSDRIHDLFAETFWGDHPLGRPILGSYDNVMKMPRKRMLEYVRRQYRAGSIVISAAGSVSHSKLVRLVRKHFDFPSGRTDDPVKAKANDKKRIHIESDDNHQTHFMLGFPGLEYSAEKRIGALALNTYLGQGMSSVLFQKVREQKGLAYSVYTYHDFYRDAGIFATYVGTDKAHVRQAIDIILTEFRRLKKNRLSSSKIGEVKAQLKGQLMLGFESTSARMSRLARHELMLGEYQTLEDTIRDIDRITPSDFLELSNLFFNESEMALAILGPVDRRAIDGLTG